MGSLQTGPWQKPVLKANEQKWGFHTGEWGLDSPNLRYSSLASLMFFFYLRFLFLPSSVRSIGDLNPKEASNMARTGWMSSRARSICDLSWVWSRKERSQWCVASLSGSLWCRFIAVEGDLTPKWQDQLAISFVQCTDSEKGEGGLGRE